MYTRALFLFRDKYISKIFFFIIILAFNFQIKVLIICLWCFGFLFKLKREFGNS